MYNIVEYFVPCGENEIEVVPKSWFDNTKNTCWWPPNIYTAKQVNNAIAKKLPHDPVTWIEYDAKIHASFSNV